MLDFQALKKILDVKNLIIEQGNINLFSSLFFSSKQLAKLRVNIESAQLGQDSDANQKNDGLQDALKTFDQQNTGAEVSVFQERVKKELKSRMTEKKPSEMSKPNSAYEKELQELFSNQKGTKKSLNLEKKSEKENSQIISEKKHLKPPLDLFGITPGFYIDGRTSVSSWIGFICSLAQIALTLFVVIIFSKSFMEK